MGGQPVSAGTGGADAGAGGVPMPVTCAPTPAGIVAFSEPSGTFEDAITVTLRGSQPGDELRYTTDHSAPTATSPLYDAPLTFEASTDLRVQVFAEGVAVGPPSGAVYVKRAGDMQHDLPVLVLDSFGHGSGHVFNLGHGVSQYTPPENVAALVDAVHELSRRYHAG